VQSGYDETWRWRMAGAGDAVEQHREWWANAVAAAAYLPSIVNRQSSIMDDRAPLASLVAELGPSVGPPPSTIGSLPDARRLLLPAALLLFACLLAEWSSRRLRGAA
jgi:hypothetical protein